MEVRIFAKEKNAHRIDIRYIFKTMQKETIQKGGRKKNNLKRYLHLAWLQGVLNQ